MLTGAQQQEFDRITQRVNQAIRLSTKAVRLQQRATELQQQAQRDFQAWFEKLSANQRAFVIANWPAETRALLEEFIHG